MEELKLCPFCGGEEVRIIRQGHREYKPTYYVKCFNYGCGVETPQKASESEVISIWNRRKGDK